jgi:hypothetical protein
MWQSFHYFLRMYLAHNGFECAYHGVCSFADAVFSTIACSLAAHYCALSNSSVVAFATDTSVLIEQKTPGTAVAA